MPQILESTAEKLLISGAELCPSCCGPHDEPGFLTIEGLRRYCTSDFHKVTSSSDESER